MSDTYYDQDGITIYHADNADVEWPTAESVGLLLTDPPYGIQYVAGDGVTTIVGDDIPFDPTHLLRYKRCVIWGAQNFAALLPSSAGWLVWAKIQTQSLIDGKSRWASAPVELAWSNVATNPKLFNHYWGGGIIHRASESMTNYHPTQKPVALMRWVLENWTEPGDLVFDPYMGSGPVARACLDLGRRYVGIEIVEEYCQAAVDRLGQLALALEDV